MSYFVSFAARCDALLCRVVADACSVCFTTSYSLLNDDLPLTLLAGGYNLNAK